MTGKQSVYFSTPVYATGITDLIHFFIIFRALLQKRSISAASSREAELLIALFTVAALSSWQYF